MASTIRVAVNRKFSWDEFVGGLNRIMIDRLTNSWRGRSLLRVPIKADVQKVIRLRGSLVPVSREEAERHGFSIGDTGLLVIEQQGIYSIPSAPQDQLPSPSNQTEAEPPTAIVQRSTDFDSPTTTDEPPLYYGLPLDKLRRHNGRITKDRICQ